MELTLALDWTPNPIHAGIFLARAKGWYRELGIDLKLIGVEEDAYQRSTIEKLLDGESHLAIMPSEMVIHSHHHPSKPVAVASLLQGNCSCFATKGDCKPGQVIRYGALGLPFEKEIVNQLWPEANFVTPPKLEIYKQLYDNHVDLIWLFKPIEGVEAEFQHKNLSYYFLEEASVPYGHAPVLAAQQSFTVNHAKELRRFLEVSARGYEYMIHNIQETIEILFALNVSGMRDRHLLKAQLTALKPYVLNENGQWGYMQPERWTQFIHWIKQHTTLEMPENEITETFSNNFLKTMVIKA